MKSRPTIAYFVTPHGFGHAARAAAVMEALHQRDPNPVFEIVTTVPEWFFAQSLTASYRLLPVACDVGMVQLDPFREDPAATVLALASFWSSLEPEAERLIRSWAAEPPSLVISDISPLGLEVARRLGVPSVLVENFTWDWIYAAYEAETPGLLEFAQRSAELTQTATLHIQCAPVCSVVAGATQVSPVSRTPRTPGVETRRALGLDDADRRPLVLLTLGGMGWGPGALDLGSEYVFVTLGGVDRLSRSESLVRLPNRSPVYPPDIVWACDAVIAKLGYSTVAECYRAGARLGYLGRPVFPESPILESFVRAHLPSIEFAPEAHSGRDWGSSLERLLALRSGDSRERNGANEVAELVLARVSGCPG
jgi:UDP:flavonoid glycosyltransferase YjiC (YdhE family)